MSATEELRRMLDERWVEYYRHEESEPLRELKEGTDRATSWRIGKASCTAVECTDGTIDLWIDHATPAQAIAATIGGGDDMLLVDALGRAVAHLERKNTELKELIRDLWISYDCDETAPSVAEHWHERMRALGVEVEG